MKRSALTIGFCLLAASASFAQTKTPFEGVWRISEEILPGTNTATTIDPQSSLIIFTRGYYTEVFVMRGQPRAPGPPPKDPQNLTDAEKIARYEQWRPFAANSGTYEIKDSTLTRRVIVAKNVNLMTRRLPHIQGFRFEDANTLWLMPIPEEAAIEPRIKLTRLE